MKHGRLRQGAARFPVSFFIHRCRWACNSTISSEGSDVIIDSLVDSLDDGATEASQLSCHSTDLERHPPQLSCHSSNHEHDASGHNVVQLCSRTNQNMDSLQAQDIRTINVSGLDSTVCHPCRQEDADSDMDSDQENIVPENNSNSRPANSDNRHRTLQEIFQIDIRNDMGDESRRQCSVQPQVNLPPQSQRTFSREHPSILGHMLPGNASRTSGVNLSRHNYGGPNSVIGHLMRVDSSSQLHQLSQRSSQDSDSSSLQLEDDLDIFHIDSLPRQLPDDMLSLTDTADGSNSCEPEAEDVTDDNHRLLPSTIESSSHNTIGSIRFDILHQIVSMPTNQWLNARPTPVSNNVLQAILNYCEGPENDSQRMNNRGRHSLVSYEINPLPDSNNPDSNSNQSRLIQRSSSRSRSSGSRSGSRSSGSRSSGSRSSRSSGRPTQQNWYFYDPRLMPGNRDNRVTLETSFLGINTRLDVPNIVAPPSYEDIQHGGAAISQPGENLDSVLLWGPPPPYSGPPSDSSTRTSINGEPPPAYEQSFLHRLGDFYNLPPRGTDGRDAVDDEVESELSDSLSSILNDDDEMSDLPCQAISDNFLLLPGSSGANTSPSRHRPDGPANQLSAFSSQALRSPLSTQTTTNASQTNSNPSSVTIPQLSDPQMSVTQPTSDRAPSLPPVSQRSDSSVCQRSLTSRITNDRAPFSLREALSPNNERSRHYTTATPGNRRPETVEPQSEQTGHFEPANQRLVLQSHTEAANQRLVSQSYTEPTNQSMSEPDFKPANQSLESQSCSEPPNRQSPSASEACQSENSNLEESGEVLPPRDGSNLRAAWRDGTSGGHGYFSPLVNNHSVFGGRPALRWSRNTAINRWMQTTQPW